MHLYAAFLGGELTPGRMGEDHEIVFVVAADMKEAKAVAKAKWGGDGRPHVDALTRLDAIDGHSITLVADAAGDLTQTEGYNA